MSGFIDVHAHFSLGGEFAIRPDSFESSLFRGAPAPGWSVEQALQFMDERGIDVQLLSNPEASTPTEARRSNEFAADVVKRHPSRFGLLASLPMLDVDAALAEIEHSLDVLRADGFVMATNYDGAYLGDVRFEPIFAEISRRGATVFVHPVHPAGIAATALGRPGPVVEFPFDTARTVTDALYAGVFERHAGMNMILSHAGGALPTLVERIASVGTLPWVEHDEALTADSVRGQLARLYFDTAIAAGPASLLPVMALSNAGQLVFGSDFPPASLPVIDANIAALHSGDVLTDSQVGDLNSNALRLFPTLAARL